MPAASTPHDTSALAGNTAHAGTQDPASTAAAGNGSNEGLQGPGPAGTGAVQAQGTEAQDTPPALLVAQLAAGGPGP